MPFSKNTELPSSVRNVLPASAQTIFRRAFNASSKSHPEFSEERLMKVAWSAVKNAGFKKSDSGKWIKESESLVFNIKGQSWEQDLVFYEAHISKDNKNNIELDSDISSYSLSDHFTILNIEEKEDKYIIEAFADASYIRQLTLSGIAKEFLVLSLKYEGLTDVEEDA